MPLEWNELEKAHPLDFTLTNVLKTLIQKGDRWRAVLKHKQDLERALGSAEA
jgi:bifunctional non-homologous end joining protein LigD